AGRGGEPRRRWWHDRDASRRQGHARWLHHPAHLYRHALYQSDALSQCRIRSAQGLRPDRLIGWQPSVLTVHPSLPVRTPSELVSYAKANPGKVNYGFVPGTIGQMTTEMFARSTGIELTRIPYKSNSALFSIVCGCLQL